MDRLVSVVAPLARVVLPEVIGLDNIPSDRGVLIVGNHTLYGLIDLPFMMFWLGKPIDTTRFAGRENEDHFLVTIEHGLITAMRAFLSERAALAA